MAAADNQPPAPIHRDPTPGSGEHGPRVGEQRRPFNSGDLGYTYSIYRFYDAADRLLYLGESGRIRQRIVDLEIGNPRGLPLGHDDGPKPWWREAVRVELQHLPPGTTESEARAEEGRQIEIERPVYNRRAIDGEFDRERQEQVLEHAHFESDVATVEHERHDGLVRDLTQIEIESRRAADQLRPGGSAMLDAIPRQGYPRPRQGWSGQGSTTSDPGPPSTTADNAEPHVTIAAETAEMSALDGAAQRLEQRRVRTPTFYPSQERGNGPGSRLGLIIVAVVLAAAVAAALIVSLQAAF